MEDKFWNLEVPFLKINIHPVSTFCVVLWWVGWDQFTHILQDYINRGDHTIVPVQVILCDKIS